MRLADLQGEGRGDRRVEGVAAALEDAHADRRGDPVGEVTTPKVPTISGRVVNGFGLISFTAASRACK